MSGSRSPAADDNREQQRHPPRGLRLETNDERFPISPHARRARSAPGLEGGGRTAPGSPRAPPRTVIEPTPCSTSQSSRAGGRALELAARSGARGAAPAPRDRRGARAAHEQQLERAVQVDDERAAEALDQRHQGRVSGSEPAWLRARSGSCGSPACAARARCPAGSERLAGRQSTAGKLRLRSTPRRSGACRRRPSGLTHSTTAQPRRCRRRARGAGARARRLGLLAVQPGHQQQPRRPDGQPGAQLRAAQRAPVRLDAPAVEH